MKQVKGYSIIQKQELNELNATGYLLRHDKTKAKVAVIENEDENKVFSIGFRTPPKDSTGVAHIVEHTVLCGSREFPAKDPFIELAKGSLNTFLNAMTYPDKTVYPVASCNDKDFQNLMHVYLDAVFYPNIYKEEKIFKQEGWHYHLDSVEGPLSYNGVVFNEMKGVFSSPEQLIERKIQQSLFPDTSYGFESGGDPVNIPDLTYQEYLDFHSRYYHPSNSYIYLYGDMDMEEKLLWMDENYLSHFDYLKVDSEIPEQKPFHQPVETEAFYSLAEGESEEGQAYLSYNAVTGTSLDPDLYLAFQVLNYVLVQGVGAPVKQALVDAGIGSEIISYFEESIRYPYFSIISKNTEVSKKQEFVTIIRNELTKLVETGINKDSLNAGLNALEFRYREADFGSYPKGLMYGLQMFDSWLYDGEKPFIHICANDTFKRLREKMEEGYFESLIQTWLLDNPHRSIVTASPKVGLTAEMDKEEAKKCQAFFDTLSQEQKEKLVRQTEELRQYQEEPTPKEDLEKIPLLSREDIGKKALGFSNIEKKIKENKVIHHDYFTNGIYYINLNFDIKPLLSEYAPYISLLTSVLACVDTDAHDKLAFSNEILQNAGDFVFDVALLREFQEPKEYQAYLVFTTKVLEGKTKKVLELLIEALSSSHLEDEKRLKEIISEMESALYMRLISAGHSTAVNRSFAYRSQMGRYDEAMGGISYYRFLKQLNDNFEEYKDNTIAILKMLCKKIFTRDNMVTGITCEASAYATFENVFSSFIEKMPYHDAGVEMIPAQLHCKDVQQNEGFKTAGQVQYVARSGNFRERGIPYHGSFRVVRAMLSYGYLWNEVRVKGGAYGVMCNFPNSGEGYFVSYRDPKLAETNETYKNVAEYLRKYEADEREMTKNIIGTISSVDTPLPPKAKGNRSMSAYFIGLPFEEIQKERDEILSTSVEDIRRAGDMVDALLADGKICVLGNEEKVKENVQLFGIVDTL